MNMFRHLGHSRTTLFTQSSHVLHLFGVRKVQLYCEGKGIPFDRFHISHRLTIGLSRKRIFASEQRGAGCGVVPTR